MKKYLFAIAAAAVASLPALADVTTVKTLYDGEAKEVTWGSTLYIPGENFTDEVKVGDYIYITFSKTTDVIEIKSNGTWLPGSRFTLLGDNTPDFKAYITEDMLAALKATGLEICGASFTVTGVSICNDGFQMPNGAIWGGYFWVDENTNTLELFKTAFDNYETSDRYMGICLSGDAGDNTGYDFNVFTQAGDTKTFWAQNNDIKHYAGIAEVDLGNVAVKANLETSDKVAIQANRGTSPNSFNITAIVLSSKDVATGVDIMADDAQNVDVYTMQGVRVRANVAAQDATTGLPAGLYIAGGKKVLVK